LADNTTNWQKAFVHLVYHMTTKIKSKSRTGHGKARVLSRGTRVVKTEKPSVVRKNETGKVPIRSDKSRKPAKEPFLLGLDTSKPLEIHDTILSGLSYKSLVQASNSSGLPLGTLSELIAIPPSTLSRRKATELLKPDESDRLFRVAKLLRLVIDFFSGDTEAAIRWMQSPRPALGGHPPLELAKTDVGIRQVETLIEQLKHGIVV
jgi:putative toxin-antitoxin system antitoxin component (TIGR02293 family)